MIPGTLVLHPGPPTEYVIAALYGGPKDGLVLPPAKSDAALGTVPVPGGRYELVGFWDSGAAAGVRGVDYAIYEWVAGKTRRGQ